MLAIILAGGRGERLRPLTDDCPKPLLEINNEPILQHILKNLKTHGVDGVILSVGYKAPMIQDYFGDGSRLAMKINYCVEEEFLGTGGAVKAIIKEFKIDQPFILQWGDNLADYDLTAMMENYQTNLNLVDMGLTERDDVEHFGVAKLEGNQIMTFVEKPARTEAPSRLINAGVFIIDPMACDILPTGQSSIERECFNILAKENKLGAFIHRGFWYPTDTLEKYHLANTKLSNII